MKIMMIASHSGGHISPALAIAGALRKRDSQAQVMFISSDGTIERQLLGDESDVVYYKKERKIILKYAQLIVLFFQSFALLRSRRPDVVVGFGGYLSIPFIMCARLSKIPTVIHEQNVAFGAANRLLHRLSNRAVTSFEATGLIYDSSNIVFAGPVVRDSLIRVEKSEAKRYFDFDPERFTIVIVGGSQGAHTLNSVGVGLNNDAESKDVQIIHITGIGEYQAITRQVHRDEAVHRLQVYSFLEEMHYAYSAADLVIARAGASTIAELIWFGVPVILVPYPYAGGHQIKNAQLLESLNACIVIWEEDFCLPTFKKVLKGLQNNPQQLHAMHEAISHCRVADAQERIIQVFDEVTQ